MSTSKSDCDIRVGTSGWHYDHWKRRFYPADLPKSRWLGHYAEHFDTVEINNTFYQLPKAQSFENWQKEAPRDFLYTVKANRYITHLKRLKDPKEPLQRFFERVNLLNKNLGPILYQLPPNFHKDIDRLRTFLKVLPKKHTAVFEFRHESWYSEDIYRLLNQFNIGFCTHDLSGRPSPRIVTGGIIYVRFHGTTGRYAGDYPKSLLADWAHWIKDNLKGLHAVYAYFNNDYNAHAIKNAKILRELLSQ